MLLGSLVLKLLRLRRIAALDPHMRQRPSRDSNPHLEFVRHNGQQFASRSLTKSVTSISPSACWRPAHQTIARCQDARAPRELWLRPSTATLGHPFWNHSIKSVLAHLAEEIILASASFQLDWFRQFVPIGVSTNRLIPSPNSGAILAVSKFRRQTESIYSSGFGQGAKVLRPKASSCDARLADV